MRTVLVLDVGNTRVKVGLFVEGRLEARLQVETDQTRDVGFFTDRLRTMFEQWAGLDACLIASVVRGVPVLLIEAVQAVWSVSPLVVNAQDNLGVLVAVPKPEDVGIDRLLEASEAFHILHSGVVVAAFGSAITIDLITDDGTFRGGTILPGLRTGLQAPEGVLGTDTVSCMQAGVVYGAAGAVDRIYQELCVLAGQALPLVVTGGDVRYVASLLQTHHQIEDDLVLRGLVSLDARIS
jgi:type III pantothenate kinase